MEPQVPTSEHSGSKRLRRNSDGGGQRDGNAPQAAAVEASLRSAHNEAYILARVKGHKHVVCGLPFVIFQIAFIGLVYGVRSTYISTCRTMTARMW